MDRPKERDHAVAASEGAHLGVLLDVSLDQVDLFATLVASSIPELVIDVLLLFFESVLALLEILEVLLVLHDGEDWHQKTEERVWNHNQKEHWIRIFWWLLSWCRSRP